MLMETETLYVHRSQSVPDQRWISEDRLQPG